MNPSSRPLHVLVIEDDPGDARLLAIALAESIRPKFRQTMATTLTAAIDILRGGAVVDVVMLDLSLPDACGTDTVRLLRDVAPDLPIVVMTGDDDPGRADRMLALGAQDYLWKGDATASSIARAARYAITRMQHLVERNTVLAQAQELARELAVARDRFARVLDCMPQHLAVLDHEGRIVMVNEAWRRFAAENGGADDYFIGHSYVGNCEASGGEFGRGVVAVLRGDAQAFSVEYPCHSPTELRWFKVDVSPLTGEDGGAVVAHTNITDLHRVQDELRHSLDVKNRMVGMLAHDLRNPLGAIGGYAEFMEMTECGLSDRGRGSLETIRESVAYMDALIDDTLTVTVVDAQHVELTKRQTDVLMLVRRVVDAVQNVAEKKGVNLRIDGERFLVNCDAVKIEQVLHNLIGNAVKFSCSGNMVTIHLWMMDGVARITITDQGTGIPPAVMANLFQPFVKGQPGTAGERSNGLGLYICARIVEAHGGRIDFQSELGRGTTFTVSLPN